jgi:pimeloyl-ACP methyl ester carboxylesterase
VPELTANGLNFHVVQLGGDGRGERPVVVFLHGLIMDNLSSFYYTLAPRVAQDADVVLYDQRGHGRTERPATGYTPDDAVTDLMSVLDALGITRPVHLVGNSYGGTVALAAAVQRPERVAGLVLIEGIPLMCGWGRRLVEMPQALVADFDQPDVQDYLSRAGRKIRKMAQTCEDLLARSSLPVDLADAPEMDVDDLASIRCPVLALYGEHSDMLEEAALIDSAVPRCELHLLEGCTHSVLMEAPDEIEDEIRAWLAAVADTPAEHVER